MWTVFKVFIEFVTILLLFYVFWFFGPEACGTLAPQPGIEPARLVLEGEVLTTALPGKSHMLAIIDIYMFIYVYILYNYTYIHGYAMKLGELTFCLNLVRVLSYPVLFRDAHVSNMFLISLCENIKTLLRIGSQFRNETSSLA